MKLVKYFFTIFFLFSLSACSLFDSEEDVVSALPSPVVQNQISIKQLWQNSVANDEKTYALLGPTSYKNIIYTANRTGHVKAINSATGKTLWRNDLSKSTLFRSNTALFSGGVSADENHVYIGSERAIVYTLDRTTGKLIWEKPVKGEVLARITPTAGRLVVYSANGYLQLLSQETGRILWIDQLDVPLLSLRGNSTPAVARNVIFIGDAQGKVNAYSIADGQLIWQQRISEPEGSSEIAKLSNVNANPVIDGNRLYASGYNGNVAALDFKNGDIIWRKKISTIHNFALDENNLFLVDQNDAIYSLSKKDGIENWQQTELLHRQLTDPVIYENYVVVADFEGYIYWLNSQNGKIVAKLKSDSSGFLSTPIVVDKKLIIQAKNGNIYALSASK